MLGFGAQSAHSADSGSITGVWRGGWLALPVVSLMGRVGVLSWKLPQARVGYKAEVGAALVLLSDCERVFVCVAALLGGFLVCQPGIEPMAPTVEA